MDLHTLYVTTAHTRSQSVVSSLAVAWLESSLAVARLRLLTIEVSFASVLTSSLDDG
jgi:hypothetical protein